MNRLIASGGQHTGVSASVSVLPMNIQSWFPLGIDWFDLLVVQGTLKSLLQYHNSKASILQSSAFFIVQLSHPYMTTGKTIALTRQILVGRGFPGGTRGKEPPANAGDIRDTNLIPGSGRSPGGGHGNPPQYSCLENPMDRGACWATVHRVTQSWTRLKHTHTHTHTHRHTPLSAKWCLCFLIHYLDLS